MKKHKLIGKQLDKHIKAFKQEQIIVDDKKYTIRIKDVIVFIEGAYPILTEEESKAIVIDMGAGTINVSEWQDMSIENSATYTESMYKMYEEISDYLNENKGSDFKPVDIEKILNKKYTTIKGKETDISDIRPIIKNYITEIASYIVNGFDVSGSQKIYLLGGGGMDTLTYWQEKFTDIQLVDKGQYINSEIYDKVAQGEFESDK
jgi:plasmid segregation protein ParM